MNHYVKGYSGRGGNRYRVLRDNGSLVVTLHDMHAAIVVARELDIVKGIAPISYGELEAMAWPKKILDYAESIR